MIRTPKVPTRISIVGDVVYAEQGSSRRLAAAVERDEYDHWLAVDEHGEAIALPFPTRARAMGYARAYAEELRP